jgi:hypothetical protein
MARSKIGSLCSTTNAKLRDDDLKIDRALTTVGKMVSPPALYSHFNLFYLPWRMLCALIERTEKDIMQHCAILHESPHLQPAEVARLSDITRKAKAGQVSKF